MSEPDLLREELVQLSVMRAITAGLPDYGYVLGSDPTTANLHVREAFPTPEERNQELTITTVAFGFNVDDGGEPAELGSNLTRYVHTLMCWVFALEMSFGKRVAYTIRSIVRRYNDVLPLLDFNQPDAPQIDALVIRRVQVNHEANNSPRPWDQYVHTVAIAAQDIAYPQ